MDKEPKLILFILLFAGLLYGVCVNYVYMHENGHQQINIQHNIDSETHYRNFMTSGYTAVTLNLSSDREWARYKKAKHYHLLNEIVGYNTFSISIAIISAAMLISAAVLIR